MYHWCNHNKYVNYLHTENMSRAPSAVHKTTTTTEHHHILTYLHQDTWTAALCPWHKSSGATDRLLLEVVYRVLTVQRGKTLSQRLCCVAASCEAQSSLHCLARYTHKYTLSHTHASTFRQHHAFQRCTKLATNSVKLRVKQQFIRGQ